MKRSAKNKPDVEIVLAVLLFDNAEQIRTVQVVETNIFVMTQNVFFATLCHMAKWYVKHAQTD